MRDIGSAAVGVLVAQVFFFLGLFVAASGVALTAVGMRMPWLAWSGAGLAVVAFGFRYLLARKLRSALEDTPKEGLITIYMPLLGEGTNVWRPVKAQKIGELGYMVVENLPADEAWAFSPGHILRCEERQLSDGRHIVAVAKANTHTAS